MKSPSSGTKNVPMKKPSTLKMEAICSFEISVGWLSTDYTSYFRRQNSSNEEIYV
jgi:hypothetical protein